ncbi:heat shock protein Hsp15 [Sphaerotilus hippei]|uniref:Heat shock protein Hsp15 n=1 Tax=Sphaerotilus hippei TaxID=744406 RepID=A0A318H9I5_9BURK|nr:RNA-binding S4 domain-containing protein [Sphaerotilus hippei]PXW95010.1 heat shock protein Hsp15 [Sphaerotilus hippei]
MPPHPPLPTPDDDGDSPLDDGPDTTPPPGAAEAAALRQQYKVDPAGSLRLDKWLWAARLFKTRALAAEEVSRGRLTINGQAVAKPAREVRAGDLLAVRGGGCPQPRELKVLAVSTVRGPAPAARLLYAETEASLAAQAAWRAQRPYQADPALTIEHGRPTKSDRRQLVEWQRWSAQIDDER